MINVIARPALLGLMIFTCMMSQGQLGKAYQKGLLLDLDADKKVEVSDSNRIERWTNTAPGAKMTVFERRDEGRKVPGSGRPTLKEEVAELNGHSTVVFLKQELLNKDEDACDKVIQGNGFTWIAVLKPYTQVGLLPDVNSFFGNLRNEGNYEGFWAGFTDDNRLWASGRNGITFGRWDVNNPFLVTPKPLDTTRYYLLAGRLGAGTGTVDMEIFVDDFETASVRGPFPVNPDANGSMLAIGQERDAIQHPGVESFNGEIARFLIFDRPLSNKELKAAGRTLSKYYGLFK